MKPNFFQPVLVALLMFLPVGRAFATALSTETVDSSGDVGQYSSVLVEGEDTNTVHICYSDSTNGQLKYATKSEGGTWTTETIDSTVSGRCSLAISDGYIVVSYYDETNKDLKGAYKLSDDPTATWTTETVDSTDEVGMYSRVVSSGSCPSERVIFYSDETNTSLKYAFSGGSSGFWTMGVVDQGSGSITGISAALDSTCGAHISYIINANSLVYAHDNGTQAIWNTSTVNNNGITGAATSLVAAGDDICIASVGDSLNSTGELKIVCGSPVDNWGANVPDVLSSSYSSSTVPFLTVIEVDDELILHAIFVDTVSGNFLYATQPLSAGSSRESKTGTTGLAASNPSLFFGGKTGTEFHMTYYDATNTDLIYVTSAGCLWFADQDGDGYGDSTNSQETCTQPAGYVSKPTDCNDSDATINPSAAEVCDGVDNDCDLLTDEGVSTTYYLDSDGDGYGYPASQSKACSQPAGYVTSKTDCNDSDSAISPSATEICDGLDNDCDKSTDEGVTTRFYLDGDGDGYGNARKYKSGCWQPAGYVTNKTDCNDLNAGISPVAHDICGDGVDQDCSGSDLGC